MRKIKLEVEKEFNQKCKVLLYEPFLPRKNMTLSITGTEDIIK